MSTKIKRMRITVEGKTYDVAVEMLDEASAVAYAGRSPAPTLRRGAAEPPRQAHSEEGPDQTRAPAGFVPSPLAGMVREIHVKEGEEVKEGDLVLTLEAMKMNTPVRAPWTGRVSAIQVRPEMAVEEGTALMTIV